MKISFIGGGNMARAIIAGLTSNGFEPQDINVIEPDADKRAQLHGDFGVQVTEQLPSVATADVIVLAVKPQQLRDLAIFLGSLLHQQLVISIAAGIRSQDLARWLGGYQSIVRVMPNTPAQIQAGISALYALPAVGDAQKQQADLILKAAGTTLWLDSEAKMDAVTAISGSGPAYVFYFIEALQQAGQQLGLTVEESRLLSLHTFSGASQLAMQSPEPPATLRAQVTSKGGTTERAISTMQETGILANIVKAAESAAARSVELGDQLGRS